MYGGTAYGEAAYAVGGGGGAPVPTVTSIEPILGPGAGGTTVIIRGTGFAEPASVTIGNAATAVEVLSPEEIRATTAATTAGAYEVVVKDPNGTSVGRVIFTYGLFLKKLWAGPFFGLYRGQRIAQGATVEVTPQEAVNTTWFR